jgi:hypothetical protein
MTKGCVARICPGGRNAVVPSGRFVAGWEAIFLFSAFSDFGVWCYIVHSDGCWIGMVWTEEASLLVRAGRTDRQRWKTRDMRHSDMRQPCLVGNRAQNSIANTQFVKR